MEVFKDIIGYEGLYEIGNKGTVRSLDKVSMYKGHSYLKGRTLKSYTQDRNHTSYISVVLSKGRKTKTFSIHRLVAKHYVPNPDNKPHVNHIDNNGTKNEYTNLEWVTHKENMKHSEAQGRQVKSHYLGGVVTGEKKKEEAKLLWNSRIGETFGGLKIRTIISLGKHPKGLTECVHCNKQQQSTLDSIIKSKPFGCRSCGLKESHRKRKVKI